MFNQFARFFNHYYILISYLIIFLLNIPVLDNLPFGDDFRFVFTGSHVADAPNPFVYFFPWSIYYKSWAMSNAVLWGIYKLFGEQVVFYRLANIILHFSNHLLFRKIIADRFTLSESKKNLFSLIFLLHPLSVLTTSWIFQIKTLLAVLFLLLFYRGLYSYSFKKKQEYLKIFIFFWLSLLSKVCAIIVPFFVISYMRGRLTQKQLIKLVIPLFLISLIYGVLNIKGITWLKEEIAYIKSNLSEKAEIKLVKNTYQNEIDDLYQEAIKNPGGVHFDIDIAKDIANGLNVYISPFLQTNHLRDKYVIALQNLSRFVFLSLGLNNYFPFYETNLQTALSSTLLMHVFIGTILILLLIYYKNEYFLMAFVLFLPISGLFYIPYMKFSYSSDHWFYPAALFLLMGMINWLSKHKYIFIFFFSLIIGDYVYTIYKYRSFPDLLSQNLKSYQNPVITDHYTSYLNLNKDWEQIFVNYTKLVDYIAFNNPNYLNQIYKSSLILRNGVELSPYYPLIAKMIIEKNDFQLLKSFNLTLSGMLPDKTLDLTESLDAIFSHKLDNHTYTKAINWLE